MPWIGKSPLNTCMTANYAIKSDAWKCSWLVKDQWCRERAWSHITAAVLLAWLSQTCSISSAPDGRRSMPSKCCSILLINALVKALHRIDAWTAKCVRLTWCSWKNIHSECDFCSRACMITHDPAKQMRVRLAPPRVRVRCTHEVQSTEELSVAALLRVYAERQPWHFLRAGRERLAAGFTLCASPLPRRRWHCGCRHLALLLSLLQKTPQRKCLLKEVDAFSSRILLTFDKCGDFYVAVPFLNTGSI